MIDPALQPTLAPAEPTAEESLSATVSRGFWGEAWLRFRRAKLSMLALSFVAALTLIALLAPAIAGTKPIVCRYKGQLYFPCLGYFVRSWENPVFTTDKFRLCLPGESEEERSRELGRLAARVSGPLPSRTGRRMAGPA